MRLLGQFYTFFFFYEKISHARTTGTNSTKSTKKHQKHQEHQKAQNASKQKYKTQISE